MAHNTELLTALARLRNRSETIEFTDLESFIADAVLSVSLLRLAYDDIFEGGVLSKGTSVAKSAGIVASSNQRDTISFALIAVEEAVELVQVAWQMAHERHVAEKAKAS